jgi:uncharacterized membrane protein YfcA
MYHFIALFVAGLFAGLVNSVAGGGALLVYPLLLSLGLPPIVANATSTITVWPGALSSAFGYRKYLKKLPKPYYWLLVPSVIGGIIGAIILRDSSNQNFAAIVPWLIMLGVVMIALQPRINSWLMHGKKKSRKVSALNIIIVSIPVFGMAIYGGYFGAGFGIIMLAILGFTRIGDIHQMNGLKNLSGAFINLTASIYFVHYGLVHWKFVPFLLLGTISGGFIGATYSDRLPTHAIRKIIIISGVIVSIYLFYKFY